MNSILSNGDSTSVLCLTVAEDTALPVTVPATEVPLLPLKRVTSLSDLPMHHLQDPRAMVLHLLLVLHLQALMATLIPTLVANVMVRAAPEDLTDTTTVDPHHHPSSREFFLHHSTKNPIPALELLPPLPRLLLSHTTTLVPTDTTEATTAEVLLLSTTVLLTTPAVLPLPTAVAAHLNTVAVDASEHAAATDLAAEDTVDPVMEAQAVLTSHST